MPDSRLARHKLPAAALLLVAIGVSGPGHAESPKLTLPEGGHEGPLELVVNRPVLNVFLGDRGPYTFVLDLGASLSVIDSDLAKELGLEVVGEQEAGVPGVSSVTRDLVQAPGLRFDDVEIGPTQLMTLDIARMSMGSFVGVMSIHAFEEVLVTFDYPAGRFRLTDEALDPAAAGVIEIEASEKGPISVPIQIDSTTLPAHIDTGSPGSITIPQRLLGELALLQEPVESGPIRLVGASGKLFNSQLEGTFSIGAIRIEDPKIAITDLPMPAVNIGSGFLTDKVLSLDLRNGLLSLLPSARGAVPSPRYMATAQPRPGGRSLGIQMRGQGARAPMVYRWSKVAWKSAAWCPARWPKARAFARATSS